MSSSNEIGISPALLQAITQTISSKNRADSDAQNGVHGGSDASSADEIIISRDPNYQQIIKVEGKGSSLEGLSEALSAMGQEAYQAGNTIIVVQNPSDVPEGVMGVNEEQVYTEVAEDNIQVVEVENNVEEQEVANQNVVGISEDSKDFVVDRKDFVVDSKDFVVGNHGGRPAVIAITENPEVELGPEPVITMATSYRGDQTQHYVPASSQSMSSVISVIASQISSQVNSKGAARPKKVTPRIALPSVAQPMTLKVVSDPSHSTDNLSTHGVIMSPSFSRVVTTTVNPTTQQIIAVPSPVKHTIAGHAESVIHSTIPADSQDLDEETPKKLRIVEMSDLQEGLENGTTIILNPSDMGDGSVLKAISTEQGAIVYRTAAVSGLQIDPSKPPLPENVVAAGCPVCGDRVSGYHYGIYSCESCKGFFKRTVQNKKAFICHRMGECLVSIANRKKCPACRFKRCLVAGMKLEAIREDRMRGGRSSYDGCSPHRPVKAPVQREPRKSPAASRSSAVPSPILIQTSSGSITIPQSSSGPSTSTGIPDSIIGTPPSSSSFPLVSSHPLDLNQVQPQTPQLLEDLMAVESLMMEEDEEQACCEGKMTDSDTNLFSSLLHFADHCLYKIVRWARNLPDFANVPTDDQIILLQNCWAELLFLCCCWKSTRLTPEYLKLSHGRTLTKNQAALMGIQDEIQRLFEFTDSLRALETDNYEFVALKALLLFSPDVKNLKDANAVRKYQDEITEALMIYTTTNSPDKSSKFCELLARLPELTRACVVGKDLLNQRQATGQVPQYSLLSELLKGDITVS